MNLKYNKKNQLIIPIFNRINLNELQNFDILNHYHGNKLTEIHAQLLQRNKYQRTTLAPYHTNGVYDFGRMFNKTFLMDTELRNTGSLLEAEYNKKNSRIDVIRRIDLTIEDKQKLASLIEEELGAEHLYGVTRFGSFAKRLGYVGWMFKWMKPSKKQVVCSGRWAKVYQTIGKPISPYDYNETIPNDITVYALKHPDIFKIYTLKKEGELF